MIPQEYFLVLSGILFAIGAFGVLTRKNAIVVLMCIEIMLNAANINFVTFSVFNGGPAGQVFALFSIAIAAAEVAVGLAILLNLQKQQDTIELQDLNLLRW
ncbi:MAG: NADH-quinone oxidoreductase subunit NuoK [Methanomassiliicoccales archaeon]|jgi:NADH-quinone oxidoreductase subunit K|nr:NADH-quinone oxidoreductase subunit NuoK [Methanomassiliicoccales archaeon]